MSRDPSDHPSTAAAPVVTPARLGRFIGHVERDTRGRRWRGRLPLTAIAPLLAAAATGRTETLLTAGASEAVNVAAVWFDAEVGDVECELASVSNGSTPACGSAPGSRPRG